MRLWSLVLILAAATTLGCGGSSYKAVPVSGRVTLDGQPVSGACVIFQPMGEKGKTANPGPGSVGVTDTDGRFTLSLVSPSKPGAVVGNHRVNIAPDTSSGKATPSAEKIPAKFRTGSSLVFPVPDGGTDKADFTLTSK
ncbi:MAG: hypothetical protein ACYC35_25165 [Pirellulales bacterium]